MPVSTMQPKSRNDIVLRFWPSLPPHARAAVKQHYPHVDVAKVPPRFWGQFSTTAGYSVDELLLFLELHKAIETPENEFI